MTFVTSGGVVAEAVYQSLQAAFGAEGVVRLPSRLALSASDLLVATAEDEPGLQAIREWNRFARNTGIILFPVLIDGLDAVFGPLVYPDRPGCLECWWTRHYACQPRARAFAEAQPETARSVRRSEIPPNIAAIVANLAAGQLLTWKTRCSEVGRKRSVYYLNLRRFTSEESSLLEDPLCPECGDLPADDSQPVILNLCSRPKIQSACDRTMDLEKLASNVKQFYVGRSALVPHVSSCWNFRYGAVAIADLWLRNWDTPEPCSGFADSYDRARTVAVLEALERYAGTRPRNRLVHVRGTAASLGAVALRPSVFGLYSARQYAANPDLLVPYHDGLEIEFVWAYSLVRSCPVLIPRDLAFYSPLRSKNIVIEGSNGCSLGACPEEAILHGIFEVIERDAVLLAWYSRRERPLVDLATTEDAETRCRLRLLRWEGFEVTAADVTTDFGIPALWLIAFRRDGRMPAVINSGAAHIYPEAALRKAVRELSALVERHRLELRSEEIARRALYLCDDPSDVRDMRDHSLAYCPSPQLRHFDFILNSSQKQSLPAMTDSARRFQSADLGIELRRVVDALRSRGQDVIAVDQTPPDQTRFGLCTYKALVTGAVPITFGSTLYRLAGLPRAFFPGDRGAGDMWLENDPPPHPFV